MLFLLAPCFGESQVAWLHRASFKMVSAWRDLDLSWDGLPGEACCLIGVDDEDGRTDLWITKNGGVPFTTAASPALHVQALHLGGTMVNFQMRQASNCHSHLKNRGCSFLHCRRACFTSALSGYPAWSLVRLRCFEAGRMKGLMQLRLNSWGFPCFPHTKGRHPLQPGSQSTGVLWNPGEPRMLWFFFSSSRGGNLRLMGTPSPTLQAGTQFWGARRGGEGCMLPGGGLLALGPPAYRGTSVCSAEELRMNSSKNNNNNF